MDRKIFKDIFKQLQQLGIIDETGTMKASYMKFESGGLMAFHVDNLLNNTISVAHNGLQNGDVMADPDVEIWIHPEHHDAEAMTFQNSYLGIYQEVYPEPGKFKPGLKKDLNIFLHEWLSNIIEAEYKLVETED